MHQIPIISNIQYFIPFRHVVSKEYSSFINVKKSMRIFDVLPDYFLIEK